MAKGFFLALAAVGLAAPHVAGAEMVSQSVEGGVAAPSQSRARTPPEIRTPSAQQFSRVNFRGETASRDARDLAEWVANSGDNRSMPFLIIDKVNAKVFAFDGNGQMRGAASALLGLGRGDDSVAGIGQRRLATIKVEERTTPAGRFEAALGHDFEQDILWIDYETSLSLHRVIKGDPKERRHQRLASATPLDNRISYGCINVPAEFYDKVVIPAFTGTVGIVYILPETRPIGDVFAIPDGQVARKGKAAVE